jgi:hypothetical protein
MSPFGNQSADVLTGAPEKRIAKTDDAHLARALLDRFCAAKAQDRESLVETLFDAFRDRGESSEDSCEEAGITLEMLAAADRDAFESLLAYASKNPGVLKETYTLLVERQPEAINDLPAAGSL